jgi:hypothetical protein
MHLGSTSITLKKKSIRGHNPELAPLISYFTNDPVQQYNGTNTRNIHLRRELSPEYLPL